MKLFPLLFENENEDPFLEEKIKELLENGKLQPSNIDKLKENFKTFAEKNSGMSNQTLLMPLENNLGEALLNDIRSKVKSFVYESFLREAVSKKLKSKIQKAFYMHIQNNDNSKLIKLLPDILKLEKENSLTDFLDKSGHKYAYRIIDFKNEKQLSAILNKPIKNTIDKYVIGKTGILKPSDPKDLISSWTINPRSLIYSGFFSVVPENSHLIVFRAKINDKGNTFFGNPDRSAWSAKTDIGYSLEREILGVGDIKYDKFVFGFQNKRQTIEGLAVDLINQISSFEDFKDDYLPEKF
jgi:hypothetical protein